MESHDSKDQVKDGPLAVAGKRNRTDDSNGTSNEEQPVTKRTRSAFAAKDESTRTTSADKKDKLERWTGASSIIRGI